MTIKRVRRVGSHLSVPILIAVLAIGPTVADDAGEGNAAALIQSLGLRAASTPAREMPGWKPPTTIIVRADSVERLAWLQAAVPAVKLIDAGNREEVARAIDETQALIGMCDNNMIDQASALHWIQIFSAGVESCIDQPAFEQRELLLTNMQRVASPEIAEHVIGMLLGLSRGIQLYIREQESGDWRPGLVPFGERQGLGGKTMLVVGLGGIGTQVAKRAAAFDMQVLAVRNSGRPGPEFVTHVGRPDELLMLAARSDVVVNSTPLTPETTGLFDAEFFAAMKPTAWFINVGRGRSVDTDALVDALESDQLAGVGLDVTDPEPLPADHPLWQMDNAIITPHVSAGSDLLRDRLFRVVRENLRRYAAGEAMLSVVDIDRGY